MNEELKIIISAQVEKLKQNVEKAKKEVNSFKEQVDKAGKDVDKNFKAMGDSIARGLKAGITALAAVGGALIALGASTAEYRQQQAMLSSAFENAGGSAAQATQTYNDLYRVLGDGATATEAAQQLAQITTNEQELAEYTTILEGVWATWGESISQPGLAEAINHTSELGSVQGQLADALEWSGISVESFNEQLAACSSVAEREKLIRETLNGLYGDAAAKYEENNAQILAQNEAQAELQATTAALGEAVAPLITAFTSFANEALALVTPYIQSFAENYLPTIQAILSGIVEALGAAFNWVSQHSTILAIMAGIITGIATAIGLYNAVAAIKAAMDAAQVTTLGALISAYLAQAAAMMVAIAPYALIVAAIAAVIAIIVVCVKHWDTIKQTVVNVASAIWSAVSSTFGAIVGIISKPMEKAKEIVRNIINTIKGFFSFSISWPKIPMPHFGITPSGWKVGDLLKGKIPKLSISWYAEGGVFDEPTLFGYGNGALGGLGEKGAEAVVPLEKNTKWLDRIATMLTEKQGGSRPIYLQVDGKTFAQISVDSINQLTRQRGSLPLKLV